MLWFTKHQNWSAVVMLNCDNKIFCQQGIHIYVLTHAMPVNQFKTINSVSEMFVKAGHVTLVVIDFRARVFLSLTLTSTFILS